MQEVLGFSSLLVLLALAAPTTMPGCFLSCLLPGLLPEARLAPGIAPSGMHLARLCGGLPVEGAEMLLPSTAQWSQHWGRRVTLSLPRFHLQSWGQPSASSSTEGCAPRVSAAKGWGWD